MLFSAEDDPQSVFAEKHEKKRSKLLLPEPQISDKELDEIIKIGHASDSVRELADDNPTRLVVTTTASTQQSHQKITHTVSFSTLLHDYTESAKNLTAARTLKTPAYAADSIAKVRICAGFVDNLSMEIWMALYFPLLITVVHFTTI